MPLEHAVRKLTGEPADMFGFTRRGYLREGNWADVCVFDPQTVGTGPTRRVRDFPADAERLTAEEPTGVRHVLVNGTPIRVDESQLDVPERRPGVRPVADGNVELRFVDADRRAVHEHVPHARGLFGREAFRVGREVAHTARRAGAHSVRIEHAYVGQKPRAGSGPRRVKPNMSAGSPVSLRTACSNGMTLQRTAPRFPASRWEAARRGQRIRRVRPR